MNDKLLEEIIDKLDAVIMPYEGQVPPHNMAALLLSRVTLLMTMDPQTGKELLKYVWEQLDEIQQGNPGQYL